MALPCSSPEAGLVLALGPGRKRQGDLAPSPWHSIRVAGPHIGRAVPVPLVVAAAPMSLRFHQRRCGSLASVERMAFRSQIRCRKAGLSETGATLIDQVRGTSETRRS